MEELKIKQKCEDMIAYSLTCLRQYPRFEKHALANDTRQAEYRLLRLIIACNKKYYKKTTQQEIDVELDTLRSFIKIAKNCGYLSYKKHDIWEDKIVELRKMLFGWMKSCRQ